MLARYIQERQVTLGEMWLAVLAASIADVAK